MGDRAAEFLCRVGDHGGSTGEIVRDDREDQPGRVRRVLPRRKMCERARFEVSIDLLNDRMMPVRLIDSDSIELVCGDGGEECVESPRIKQRRLLP